MSAFFQLTFVWFSSFRNRAKDAEQKLADAEKRLREIDDKDKSELEKAQRDLKELKDEVEPLRQEVDSVKAELAFFKADQARLFHDPADALREIDISKVKTEDGDLDLKKLASECEALLKRKPYLGKTEGEGSAGSTGTSGRPANGKQPKPGDKEVLEQKFPALRGR